MKTVFADTFYWIALTAPADTAYGRAHQITNDIVTIDEVLSEYLTFFSTSAEHLRRKAAMNVDDILHDPSVRVLPCRRCAGKD